MHVSEASIDNCPYAREAKGPGGNRRQDRAGAGPKASPGRIRPAGRRLPTPALIGELKLFGQLAGLKINKDKTVMITKNLSPEEEEKLSQKLGFKIVKQMKYLGITITKDSLRLFENNYGVKWKEIKENIVRWKNLNLSLLGRIAVIKMVILPKLIFLFLNLPIFIKQSQFKEWDKELSKFIWKGAKPRIKSSTLKDAKKNGGYALPDL